MEKSADAFRTISEVAEHLDTPAHVLRFWESRFPQIKPVKRAGGRRYYRPSDVALLVGIRRLLHDEGMTIRGVQKILREQGVRHVAGLVDDPAPGGEIIDAEALPDDAADFASDSAPSDDNTDAADEAALDALIATTLTDQAPATALEPMSGPEAGTGLSGIFGATGEGGAKPPVLPSTAVELPQPADVAPPAAATPEPPRQMPLFAPEPLPAAPATPVAEEVETTPVANRLRRLRRKQLVARRTELAALAARLSRLRDKLASAPPAARN